MYSAQISNEWDNAKLEESKSVEKSEDIGC